MKRKIIKIISVILIAAFAAQDVVWANPEIGRGTPGQSTLQIPLLTGAIQGGDVRRAIDFRLREVIDTGYRPLAELGETRFRTVIILPNGVKVIANFRPGDGGKVIADCETRTNPPVRYSFEYTEPTKGGSTNMAIWEKPALVDIDKFDDMATDDWVNPYIIGHIKEGSTVEVDERTRTVKQIHLKDSSPRGPPIDEAALVKKYAATGVFDKIAAAKDPALLRSILSQNKNFRFLTPDEKDKLVNNVVQKITLSFILGHALAAKRRYAENGERWVERVVMHSRTGVRYVVHGLEPTIWMGKKLFDRLSVEEIARALLEECQHMVKNPRFIEDDELARLFAGEEVPPELKDGVWINRDANISCEWLKIHHPELIIWHDVDFMDHLLDIAKEEEARAGNAPAAAPRGAPPVSKGGATNMAAIEGASDWLFNRNSKDFIIDAGTAFDFKDVIIEQRQYEMPELHNAIYPVIEILLNGKKYRIGSGYYIVITLAGGKRIYWGGQHNLAYSFFFEHYREKTQELIKNGGIVWNHLDTHADFGSHSADKFAKKDIVNWEEEAGYGLSHLTFGNWLGYLVTTGAISRLYWADSLNEPKHAFLRKACIPWDKMGIIELAKSINGGVMDLDIDIIVGYHAEMDYSEAISRFNVMKDHLLTIADKSDVCFLINSSELDVNCAAPFHIDPRLAVRFNGTLIKELAAKAEALHPVVRNVSEPAKGGATNMAARERVFEKLRGGRIGEVASGEKDLLDVFDEHGNLLSNFSPMPQGEVHEKGYWHKTAHIYVITNDGQLVLQKRSLQKKNSPGKYQVSVCGHMNTGEDSIKAAIRETEEELGIKLSASRLMPVTAQDGIRKSYEIETGQNNEFVTVYAVRLRGPEELEEIRRNYNLKEVELIGLVAPDRLGELLSEDNASKVFSKSLRHLLMPEGAAVFDRIKRIAARQTLNRGIKLRLMPLIDEAIQRVKYYPISHHTEPSDLKSVVASARRLIKKLRLAGWSEEAKSYEDQLDESFEGKKEAIPAERERVKRLLKQIEHADHINDDLLNDHNPIIQRAAEKKEAKRRRQREEEEICRIDEMIKIIHSSKDPDFVRQYCNDRSGEIAGFAKRKLNKLESAGISGLKPMAYKISPLPYQLLKELPSKTIGEMIVAIRQARHFIQAEMRKKAGLANSTCATIESRNTIPDPGHLFNLSRVLEVDPLLILKGKFWSELRGTLGTSEKIRLLRLRNGWTQEKLAEELERAGLKFDTNSLDSKRTTITQWERGVLPAAEKRPIIASVLSDPDLFASSSSKSPKAATKPATECTLNKKKVGTDGTQTLSFHPYQLIIAGLALLVISFSAFFQGADPAFIGFWWMVFGLSIFAHELLGHGLLYAWIRGIPIRSIACSGVTVSKPIEGIDGLLMPLSGGLTHILIGGIALAFGALNSCSLGSLVWVNALLFVAWLIPFKGSSELRHSDIVLIINWIRERKAAKALRKPASAYVENKKELVRIMKEIAESAPRYFAGRNIAWLTGTMRRTTSSVLETGWHVSLQVNLMSSTTGQAKIGHMLMEFALVDGRLSIIFREIQTYRVKQDGYPSIDEYEEIWIKKWVPEVIRYFCRNFGIKDFYLSNPQEIKSTNWPMMEKVSQKENYILPFKDWLEGRDYQYDSIVLPPGTSSLNKQPKLRNLRKFPKAVLNRYLENDFENMSYSNIRQFYPAEKEIACPHGERLKVGFDIYFDRQLYSPEKQLKASIWCGEPGAMRTTRGRGAKNEKVPKSWMAIPMRIGKDYGNGHYRFAGRLPRDFEGEYTFKFSIDGGETWGWVAQPGDNFKVRIKEGTTTVYPGTADFAFKDGKTLRFTNPVSKEQIARWSNAAKSTFMLITGDFKGNNARSQAFVVGESENEFLLLATQHAFGSWPDLIHLKLYPTSTKEFIDPDKVDLFTDFVPFKVIKTGDLIAKPKDRLNDMILISIEKRYFKDAASIKSLPILPVKQGGIAGRLTIVNGPFEYHSRIMTFWTTRRREISANGNLCLTKRVRIGGTSGSPVLNEEGQVVGMVHSHFLSNRKLIAVTGYHIAEFLKDALHKNYGPDAPPTKFPLGPGAANADSPEFSGDDEILPATGTAVVREKTGVSQSDTSPIMTPRYLGNGYSDDSDPYWEPFIKPVLRTLVEKLLPPLLESAPAQTTGKQDNKKLVLELGAGTGTLRELLGQKIDKDIKWIELDYILENLKSPRVFDTLKIAARIQDTPIADSSASMVVSLSAVDILPVKDLQQTAKRIYKIMRPGGIFVHISDSHPSIGVEEKYLSEYGQIPFPYVVKTKTYNYERGGFRRVDRKALLSWMGGPSCKKIIGQDQYDLMKRYIDNPEDVTMSFLFQAGGLEVLYKLGEAVEYSNAVIARVPSHTELAMERIKGALSDAGFQIETSGILHPELWIDRSKFTSLLASLNMNPDDVDAIEYSGEKGGVNFYSNPEVRKKGSGKVLASGVIHVLIARKSNPPLKPAAAQPIAAAQDTAGKDVPLGSVPVSLRRNWITRWANAAKSVFMLIVDDSKGLRWWGHAFVVGETENEFLILTNYHMFEECLDPVYIKLYPVSGTEKKGPLNGDIITDSVPFRLIKKGNKVTDRWTYWLEDMNLISVEKRFFKDADSIKPLPILPVKSASVHGKLAIVGGRHSHRWPFWITEQKYRATSYMNGNDLCLARIVSRGGVSGSPVLNTEGEVVGIATMAPEGSGYISAIPGYYIMEFLKDALRKKDGPETVTPPAAGPASAINEKQPDASSGKPAAVQEAASSEIISMTIYGIKHDIPSAIINRVCPAEQKDVFSIRDLSDLIWSKSEEQPRSITYYSYLLSCDDKYGFTLVYHDEAGNTKGYMRVQLGEFKSKKDAYITEIAVAEDSQGKKIGKALMAVAMKRLEDMGIEKECIYMMPVSIKSAILCASFGIGPYTNKDLAMLRAFAEKTATGVASQQVSNTPAAAPTKFPLGPGAANADSPEFSENDEILLAAVPAAAQDGVAPKGPSPEALPYRDVTEALKIFKNYKISWSRTTPEMWREFLRILAGSLNKQPGALVVSDFNKPIPQLNNKRLDGLLYYYCYCGLHRMHFGKDAIASLKRDLGIEEIIGPMVKPIPVPYKGFKEAPNALKNNEISWSRTTPQMWREFLRILAGSLNKQPGALTVSDFLKPIPQFNNKRLNGLSDHYVRLHKIYSLKDALISLKKELGIEDMVFYRPKWTEKKRDWNKVYQILEKCEGVKVDAARLDKFLKTVWLSKSTVAALSAEVKEGDFAARETLIKAFNGLIYRYANKHYAINKDIELSEFEQEGRIALQGCVERFEPSRDVPLPDYCSQRISGAMLDLIRVRKGLRKKGGNKERPFRDTVYEKGDAGYMANVAAKPDTPELSEEAIEQIAVHLKGRISQRNIDIFTAYLRGEFQYNIAQRYELSNSAISAIVKQCRDLIALEIKAKSVQTPDGFVLQFYLYNELPPDLKTDALYELVKDMQAKFQPEAKVPASLKDIDRTVSQYSHMLVVFADNKPIALYRFLTPVTRKTCLANGIFVHSYYRRKGVGRITLDEVCRYLKSKGFINFTINVSNERSARAFFEGFIKNNPDVVKDIFRSKSGTTKKSTTGMLRRLTIDLASYEPEYKYASPESRNSNAVSAAPAVRPARFLRHIVDTKELTQNMIEGILSELINGKKLTLAFSRKLKGLESGQLRALVQQLKAWKEATSQRAAAQGNKAMKTLLDNFTVLEYDDLKKELENRGINVNAKDGLIFNYAPKPEGKTADTVEGDAMRPVYIIEQEGGFPADYYYPLLEMVTISIAKELLQWNDKELKDALAASDIDAEFFGIDTLINPVTGYLIFKVLPKMERYDNNSRIDRYTRLLQFLHSA